MKKLYPLLLFTLIPLFALSQKSNDSVEVDIDTIHVRGFVYDKLGKPIKDVKISTNLLSTMTTENGYFELKGIQKGRPIAFVKDSLSSFLYSNSSRFIIYNLVPLPTRLLMAYDHKMSIEAKRITPRRLIKKKTIDHAIFITYETLESYPGGIQTFYNYIQNNLRYPEKAIINNIEGMVVIEFDVTTTGTINNIKIIKDIGYGCADEVVKVLKTSKKWNPALINAIPLKRKISIEIPFKLID
ncbi:TonB family protein [Pedobacter sp. Hv1]|uniref:TonB family protein n=1 Tax=Pedobacter sp. Hv1 TaxID=1740090 RepID=UPI0006D88F3F|nr:TonB family protein [Pedobacter sp. Hv1]KQC00147.1 hypothetical protein AQF98_11620 [Pedobacter sp. Hv1]